MIAKNKDLISQVLLFILSGFFIFVGINLIYISQKIYETSLQEALALNPPALDKVCTECIKDGYSQALLFFALALGILLIIALLPRLQSIGFGGFSISLNLLKSDVENLKAQTNLLQEQSADTGGGGKVTIENIKEVKSKVLKNKIVDLKSKTNPDDPQKGKWGGLPEVNGRKLSAIIQPSYIPSFYIVVLTVEATDKNNPLIGNVQFHLHPSFKNQDPIISVVNGKAELRLNWVYGAFTVGAEADDSKTKLELDLTTVPGITDEFKNG
ncbi:pYEATS domain-containing protein [Siphonobacter sp. SORGH_AS_1065]|uniref:pYEATS domain-containing protein n=1 Tax=Siphonobacter sp. SORGH_AS_1065 TaxID=3041795 RepID=UPI00278AC57F|nr:pYEATS domain-containing protein [Siphonobacter sp. SORGH_AS_1065]MDQ1089294.1 hypothetical protein [Siphonobacter sp. SORGH_AS_1065]